MQSERPRPNRNMTNLVIDIAIFIAFLIAMAPHFSGIAIHEWLSIAFGAAIVTHLLLHWSWIVNVTRRFFGRVTWMSRLNYLLNTLLFIDMTVIIFTGLLISEVALPFVGIDISPGSTWRRLHSLSADLCVPLIGLHVALHWSWIVSMARRYLIAPLMLRRATPQPALGSSPKEV
jgi:Domain of unknown function (DUF4405)